MEFTPVAGGAIALPSGKATSGAQPNRPKELDPHTTGSFRAPDQGPPRHGHPGGCIDRHGSSRHREHRSHHQGSPQRTG